MPFMYKPHTAFDSPRNLERCTQAVSDYGRSVGFHQCSRNGKYPDDDGNLWCKQHHPDTVKAKREAEEKKWEEDNEKLRRKWERDAAEKDFCAGVSTEFLENNSLQKILDAQC